jgi:glycosyltransferase involved in cell wall biosynthesis
MSKVKKRAASDDGRRMMPTKIAHAVYSLMIGGSEVLAWRIAKALNINGVYDCSLYAVDRGGPLSDALSADKIKYRVFSRKSRIDLRLLGALAAQLRADKIQLVHTHHLGQLLYAGLAARLVGAKVVHTEHEFYSLSNRRLQILLWFLVKMADVVTAVNDPVSSFLRDQVGIPSPKIVTIQNGIDISPYLAAMPIARSELGWSNNDVVVGCVARLEPEKGVAILLEAFSLVLKHQPNAKLLIAGDGGERERLRSTSGRLGLNGSVHFLGTRSDIPEVLATCNVVALPSIHEGLPMALLEAMAAGKAVVATRVGAIPDVVRDGRSGLLVPPGNVTSFAQALSFLIGDQNKRQEMGVEAHKVVKESYSFNRMIESYEALYQSVLSGRPI